MVVQNTLLNKQLIPGGGAATQLITINENNAVDVNLKNNLDNGNIIVGTDVVVNGSCGEVLHKGKIVQLPESSSDADKKFIVQVSAAYANFDNVNGIDLASESMMVGKSSALLDISVDDVVWAPLGGWGPDPGNTVCNLCQLRLFSRLRKVEGGDGLDNIPPTDSTDDEVARWLCKNAQHFSAEALINHGATWGVDPSRRVDHLVDPSTVNFLELIGANARNTNGLDLKVSSVSVPEDGNSTSLVLKISGDAGATSDDHKIAQLNQIVQYDVLKKGGVKVGRVNEAPAGASKVDDAANGHGDVQITLVLSGDVSANFAVGDVVLVYQSFGCYAGDSGNIDGNTLNNTLNHLDLVQAPQLGNTAIGSGYLDGVQSGPNYEDSGAARGNYAALEVKMVTSDFLVAKLKGTNGATAEWTVLRNHVYKSVTVQDTDGVKSIESSLLKCPWYLNAGDHPSATVTIGAVAGDNTGAAVGSKYNSQTYQDVGGTAAAAANDIGMNVSSSLLAFSNAMSLGINALTSNVAFAQGIYDAVKNTDNEDSSYSFEPTMGLPLLFNVLQKNANGILVPKNIYKGPGVGEGGGLVVPAAGAQQQVDDLCLELDPQSENYIRFWYNNVLKSLLPIYDYITSSSNNADGTIAHLAQENIALGRIVGENRDLTSTEVVKTLDANSHVCSWGVFEVNNQNNLLGDHLTNPTTGVNYPNSSSAISQHIPAIKHPYRIYQESSENFRISVNALDDALANGSVFYDLYPKPQSHVWYNVRDPDTDALQMTGAGSLLVNIDKFGNVSHPYVQQPDGQRSLAEKEPHLYGVPTVVEWDTTNNVDLFAKSYFERNAGVFKVVVSDDHEWVSVKKQDATSISFSGFKVGDSVKYVDRNTNPVTLRNSSITAVNLDGTYNVKITATDAAIANVPVYNLDVSENLDNQQLLIFDLKISEDESSFLELVIKMFYQVLCLFLLNQVHLHLLSQHPEYNQIG